MEYLCQDGFSEDGRRPALSWLHDRSRLKSTYLVPHLTHTLYKTKFLNHIFDLNDEVFKQPWSCMDTDILKVNQQLIWIAIFVRRL